MCLRSGGQIECAGLSPKPSKKNLFHSFQNLFHSFLGRSLIGLLAILLVLAAFSGCTFDRALAFGAQGFGLALLVALVFIFDEPFKDQTALSPGPIITVIEEMEARNE